MKLIAILRIKDEILNIERCLTRLTELVDEIVILDNGSTDGTLDVYPKFPKVIEILHTIGFDEGRDKIMLLDAAKKRNPDWILWTDGDEVFESSLNRNILNKYMQSKYNRVMFRMCNFWLSEELYRIDGKYFQYTLHPQRSMWRNAESAYFQNRHIHNGDIAGVPKPYYISPYRLKHFGYVNEEKMRKKYNLYKDVDAGGSRTYEHLNPDIAVLRVRYISFKNPIFNCIFIYVNKYMLTGVHIVYRVWRKIIFFINRETKK